MAKKQAGVWGIDLGQCGLKALRLEVIDGTITATAFDYIEHPKILSQPDADPDQLTRAALEQFVSRNNIAGDQIAISIPGQTGLARFVKLPPVEPRKIPDIVKFEAKQQIPFSLDEVVWDWQIVASNSQGEGVVENEIGLFAIKRDLVYRALQAFKDVNIEAHVIQMAPLALCNFVAYDVLGKGALDPKEPDDGGDQDCTVAMDMGVDNTNLVVTDGGRVIWQRAIPIGGNHFTRALTKEMKLTFAKAEHLKRNATKAEDPKKIFQSMKPVFSDFVGELQRSLSFFTNSHRQAQIKRMVGLGNAFRLPGLQKFVSQSMGLEVERPTEFNRLVGDEVKQSPVYADNVLSFAVAYGLALQGLKATRLTTNLLPQDVRTERLVRDKKPFALTAAASLLLGVGVFAAFSGSQFTESEASKKEADAAKSVVDNHNRTLATFKSEMDELKAARAAATQILRGSEERTNWALLYRFINDCLPQPDGTNLPNRWLRGMAPGMTPYLKYFGQSTAGRKALEIKRERDREGVRHDEVNMSHLVQINITGVWVRYCTLPLATNFFANVKKQALPESTDTARYTDWQSPPKEPGWAVEIRGYTYHEEQLRFVQETFLENLNSRKWVYWPLNDPQPQRHDMRISHVAILQVATVDESKELATRLLGQTGLYLNELIGKAPEGAAAGGDPAGGGQAGQAGGGAGGTGILGAGRAGPGAGGAGAAGGGGGSSDSGETGATGRGDWEGRGMIGGGDWLQPPPTGKASDRKRYEFVIVFYWVERLTTEPPLAETPAGGGPPEKPRLGRRGKRRPQPADPPCRGGHEA